MCPPPSSLDSTNLHAPVDRDGKKVSPVSWAGFAAFTLLGIPFWLAVLLPLTAVYQLGKAAIGSLSFSNENPKDNKDAPWLDSGYQVSKDDIIPRSDRTYDVVVLGATGFTGRLAALHLAKTYGVSSSVKWAIAGRSKEKLNKVKESLAKEVGNPEINNVPIIVLDTSVPATLPKLVRDTRAVVTTVGPFRKYGSRVVEFCAKFGTHYADITGEADWAKTMMNSWQEQAKQSGAKIVPFCGCDSIPWDLSVYKLAETLNKEKQQDLVSVKCFDEFVGGASGGTLETMRLSMQGSVDLADLGKAEPFRNTAQGTAHVQPFSEKMQLLPTKLQLPWLEDEQQSFYGSFFVMSVVNSEVVSWTQALRQGAPLTYSECSSNPDLKTAIVNHFSLVLFFTALLNPITTFVLEKFVLPAPGQGPSMEQMTNESYCSVYSEGVGADGSKVESLLYTPTCTGYLATGRMLAESGLSMALEEDKVPSKGGGFFTPAYGLGNVLLDRLTETGTHFSVRCKD